MISKEFLSGFFVLLFALFFSGLCFASNIHCFRQDIDREFGMQPGYSFSNGTDLAGGSKYDHVVSLGSRITFTNLNSAYEYVCDNSYSITAMNFFALRDKIRNVIVKTNAIDATSGLWRGPLETTNTPFCVDSSGNICYKKGRDFIPERATCDKGHVYYGIGNSPSFTFDLNAAGEYVFSLELGAISPSNVSPNAANILYRPVTLTNGKKTLSVFVGSSNLIVFGQQNLKKINSFFESGESTEEVFFTVLNKSYLNAVVKNYKMNCSIGAKCEVELGTNGSPLYAGFTVKPGEALIIPGKIIVQNNARPIAFSASLDVNYGIDGVIDCDNALDGNDCSTFSVPMTYNAGLLDQQDFQVEVSKETEVTNYCVGEDGVVGKTGPSIAPRINLFFGTSIPNDSSSRIGINECDKDLVSGEPNSAGVYCTQREFLVALAEKIAKIGELRKLISARTSSGAVREANELRAEEARVSSFKSYLRAQDIDRTKITASLARIEAFKEIFSNIGFEQYLLTMGKVKTLINAVKFSQKNSNGLRVEETSIEPGLYSVSIEVNELRVNNYSEYLFSGDSLNPALEFKVSLEKISPPAFNWFFYEEDVDDFAQKVLSMSDPNVLKPTANVLKRGTILEFEKRNNVVDANFFYKSFAVPLFIRLSSRGGLTDVNFEARNYSPIAGAKPQVFSFWTGFASSLSDGCESTAISRITGGKELPYRIPDSNLLSLNVFALNDFRNMAADSNLYLETVIYLPKITNPLQEGIRLAAPFGIFTPGISCSYGSSLRNCIMDINSATPFVVSDLQSLFNSIRDENACVYKETGLNSGKWIVFWNEQKILEELKPKKNQITDAKLCETRTILSS